MAASTQRRDDATPLRLRRLVLALLGLAAIGVLATTWLSSSAIEDRPLGQPSELLVINDAGPVRVRSLDQFEAQPGDESVGGAIVRTSSSWLLRAPQVEVLAQDGSVAVRVVCDTRFPCRSSVEVFVLPAAALSIVAADHQVQIDDFDGALSVFAGDGGVVLGSIGGSVGVVTAGPVTGTSLGPTQLTVEVIDADVELTYLEAPTVLAVVGGAGNVDIGVPDDGYFVDAAGPEVDIGIESDPDAERRITVRSGGSVSIGTTEQTG